MSPDNQREFDSTPPTGGQPYSGRRKALWVGVVVVILAALVFVVHQRIAANHGGFRPPGANRGGFGPLAVGVAQASTGDVPITIDSLGTVTPLATVTVHPQVTGPLISIPFVEGQMVKAGQLLAQIDPRPFQAAVDQAMGQLEHDQALLANARVDLDRYQMLMQTNSVAEQTYATQQATVLQDQATVVADKAGLETAKLNLSYTRIVSPVTGRVGLRQVDNGNVVTAYSSTIAVVTQLQPMSVLFTIPEDNLSEVLHRLQHGEKLAAVAYDRTFTTKLDSGVLSNSDNQVDTATGTLKLRAMFNNSDYELFPDEFVNIRLTLDTLHNQVLVPGAAVQTGALGTFVYVVDAAVSGGMHTGGAAPSAAVDPPEPGAGAANATGPNGAGAPGGRRRGARGGFGNGAGGFGAAAGPVHLVHVRYVKTGPTVGNMVSITSGLQPGETVVVDGAEQLRDGAPVTIPNPPDDGSPASAGSAGGDASQSAASGSPEATPAAVSGGAAASGRFHGQHRRGGGAAPGSPGAAPAGTPAPNP